MKPFSKLPTFNSFVWAGFECSYPLVREGDHMLRWDLLRDSKHDEYVREDYELVSEIGIKTVREGLAWHQIDKGNGVYDFSRYEKMMQAASHAGIEQIWDLNHYDYPERLDIFSEEFVQAFTRYAQEVVQVIRKYRTGTIFLVLINEISYWSWIGGDLGKWAPFTVGVENGVRLKSQLIRATIAAMDAIRQIDPEVRFIQVDPFMYRQAVEPASSEARRHAQDFNDIARFQTWDMLSGRAFPELGGSPDYLDILGVNYYVDNQQWLITSDDGKHTTFERVPLDHRGRKTIGEMLSVVYDRYQRPLVIAETGSYGEYREAWWSRALPEIQQCLENGLPLCGVCCYPTVDNPDEGHFLAPHSGLWDFVPGDQTLARVPYSPALDQVANFVKKTHGVSSKK